MTDTPHMRGPIGNTPALTCGELAAQLPSYVTATLPDRAARAVEWHAAHCPTCEAMLERALGVTLHTHDVSVLAEQVPFSDAQREHLRDVIVGRIRHTRTARRWSRAWPLAVGTLLAASLVLVVTRTPGGQRDQPIADRTARGADSAWTTFTGVTSAPMRAALQLARAEAAPEFAALDTAARELDRALATTPDDQALREFREALDARRRELELRVARVTE